LERWNEHLYDRGGMRRVHLRGRNNILKRLVVHAGAANLGLLMRKLFGVGTPKGLQGRLRDAFLRVTGLLQLLRTHWRQRVPNRDRILRLPLFQATESHIRAAA
jgi:transposase